MSGNSIGWFEQLRRDGALFAFVGAIILVANLFQPLAQASAAEADPGWTICTTHGVTNVAGPGDSGKGPDHSRDCPLCIGTNHCGGMSAPKLLLSAAPAFMPLNALRDPATPVASSPEPRRLPGDPPPAIRAPPLSA